MNYELKVLNVDLASFLVSLGYAMKKFLVTSTLDLNNPNVKRPKSGQWSFDDVSQGYTELGTCEDVMKKYQLPSKGKAISNLAEYAKLTAHNYQVLKSVVTEKQPLQQIICDGYTVLKNDNGQQIPITSSSYFDNERTSDLWDVATACSLGCSICGYYFDENQQLNIMLNRTNDMSLKKIEDMKNKVMNAETDNDDYSPLSVLVSTGMNRKELMSGVWNEEKILIVRGEKMALIDKKCDKDLKQKVIDMLNN